VWRSGLVEEFLRRLLAERLGIDPAHITPEASFAELGLDSLAQVELVMELEEELGDIGLTIPDDVAERIQSVEDLLRYLKEIEEQRRREDGES
jgi:acyl carrier protein